MRAASIAFLVFCWTSLSVAKEVYLPISGSVGVFRTDTRIFNPSYTKVITIKATFLPAGQDNSAATARDVKVNGRQMLVLNDVVSSLFGGSGLGAIRLVSSDDFIASSRIHATTSAGTLGQFSAGVETSAAKTRGVLIQLKASGTQSGTFRTNMGFVNPNSSATEVTIRTYDATNTLAGSPDKKSVQPFSVLFPVSMDPTSADLRDAWIAYEATQPVIAFASVIDNGTTDPTFIGGVEDTGVPAPIGCAPVKAGEYSFAKSNFPRRIALDDDFVYVATSSHVDPFNFRAFDVSDRSKPRLRGSTALAGDLDSRPSVEVAGNYAYVTSSLGLYVIDVSNPDSLSVTRFQIPSLVPAAVRVSGRYAYVVGDKKGYAQGRLSVLDISTPSSPKEVGAFEGSDTSDHSNYNWDDVEIIGTTMFISTDPPGIGEGGGAIRAIDVSNPAAPKDAGRIADEWFGSALLGTDGTYLLVLGPRSLFVIDVSNPASMKQVASADYGGRQTADDFHVGAGLAVVPDIVNDKVSIFDVSKLPAVQQLASISVDGPYRVEADQRVLAVFLYNDQALYLYSLASCFPGSSQ